MLASGAAAPGTATPESTGALTTDVLVVGAGPAGLMLADRLAASGVLCVVVDGPVSLVGDAAPAPSPVGAQGRNTGRQDAHGLVLAG